MPKSSFFVNDHGSPIPLVSISILTYNHENMIARCIESVLSQEVDFPIEIIIGDDNSTDKTTEIIKQYESAHPDIIYGIYHNRNYDAIPGRINNVTNLRACRGKYIAMLDGDDYWTYTHKLNKQITFLEANPSFHLCFHDVLMDFENAPELSGAYSDIHYALRDLLKHKEETEFEFSDIYQYGGSCMATSSMVYRAEKIRPLPDWFFTIAAADYSLQLLAARGAKIKYFPQIWGVYTRHGKSISHNYFQSTENLENKLREFEIYKKNFSESYRRGYFKRVKSNVQFKLGKHYLKDGSILKGGKQIVSSIFTDPRQSIARLLKFLGI